MISWTVVVYRVLDGAYVDKARSDDDACTELLDGCEDHPVDGAEGQLVEYHGQEDGDCARC